MKKPNPKAYGSENELWEKGGKKAYESAYLKWAEYREKYCIKPGRKRSRPIHESWNDYLKCFNPNNPQRSQGAFCRWSHVNRATFSSMQTRQITIDTEELISVWLEEMEKEVKGE
jgi:hypothetical protein